MLPLRRVGSSHTIRSHRFTYSALILVRGGVSHSHSCVRAAQATRASIHKSAAEQAALVIKQKKAALAAAGKTQAEADAEARLKKLKEAKKKKKRDKKLKMLQAKKRQQAKKLADAEACLNQTTTSQTHPEM